MASRPVRESGEDADHEPAVGCRDAEVRALAGEHAQSDAAFGEAMHEIDQLPQATASTIELSGNQRVAVAQVR